MLSLMSWKGLSIEIAEILIWQEELIKFLFGDYQIHSCFQCLVGDNLLV